MPDLVLVPGHGPLTAKIACIGESPGEEEVLAKQLFISKSGQMLREWLQCAGIDTEGVYFDNVCPIRPEGNKFEQIYDTNGQASNEPLYESGARGWLGDLHKRLSRLESLRCVVAVGGWPARLLTSNPTFSSTRQRGDCVRLGLPGGKTVWVVCTLHPSYLLHRKTLSYYQFFALRDCTKARLIASGANPDLLQPRLTHAQSFPHALWILRHVKAHLSKDPTRKLVVDVETMGQAIDTIGFGIQENGKYHGYSIGFEGTNGHAYTFTEELALWRGIQHILAETPNPKGNQNLPFDMRHLNDHGVDIQPVGWDTLWAAHVRSPALPRSLAHLASLYTWVNYYKEERVPFGEIDLERRWLYCAKDAAVTLEVWDRQEEDLRRSPNLYRLFTERQLPMLLPFHRMEVEGIPIDQSILRARGEEIREQLKPLQDELTELRYGKGAHEHWSHVQSVGKQWLATAREKLSNGRIKGKCVKCGGTGERTYKKGTSTCKVCSGRGTTTLAKWKSLIRLFETQLRTHENSEPRLNVKGDDLKEWLFGKISQGGLGLSASLTEKGNFQLDEQSLQLQLMKLRSILAAGSPSTTISEKVKARIHFTERVLTTVLSIRGLRTELENFVDMKVSPDGKLRTSYAPLEDSGRCHSRPDHYGYGRNLQNLPRKNPDGTGGYAKKAIHSPQGCLLLGFDLKQAEALVPAWDSRDGHFLEAVIRGTQDVHTQATEVALQKKKSDYPPNEWKNVWRQAGKRLKHGFTYGMGPQRAWEQLLTDLPGIPITQEEVATGLRRLALAYPLTEAWKQNTIERAKRERKISSPYGRTFFFYDEWAEHISKVALAYRPQSTVGDYLNGGLGCGLVGFHHYWWERDRRVKVLAQKHDECVWMAPQELAKETLQSALKYWTVPMVSVDPTDRKHKGNLIIPMEFFSGPNMKDLEELKDFNNSIDWWGIYQRVQ